jgi:hypothetical protein
MVAFLLVICLFCTWGFIGYTLLFTFWSRRNLLQNLLLAPAIGVAFTVVLVFWLNRTGLPVGRFGSTLTIILLIASALACWKQGTIFPFRHFRFFALILFLTLFVTGRPLLEFGFNWLAVANDDMGNYVLGAHRFVDYGFFDVLPFRDLFQNRDVSSYYWEMHVRGGVRAGSELLLAWVISCTPWTGHQIFMPVIVALNLCLVSAAGAMALQSRKMRNAATMVCLLLGLSALTTLGMTLQLIGQVFGLTLLISCVTLLMRRVSPICWRRLLRWAVLAGFQMAAIFIVYPEVSPFLALSCLVYFALQLMRKRLRLKHLVSYLGVVGFIIAALLNNYLTSAYAFLRHQAAAGTGNWAGGKFVMLPYYLLPSGLAQFWGFVAIGPTTKEPLLSICILAGAILLLLSAVAILIQAWRGQPAAMVAFVMLLVSVSLVRQQADYGLFKMAMFIQPFLIATIVRAWLHFNGEVGAEQSFCPDV